MTSLEATRWSLKANACRIPPRKTKECIEFVNAPIFRTESSVACINDFPGKSEAGIAVA